MDSKIYVNYRKAEYLVTQATEETYTLTPLGGEIDPYGFGTFYKSGNPPNGVPHQSITIPTAKAKHINYKSKSVKHVRKFAKKIYATDALASEYVERLAANTGGYREAYCYLSTQIA